jgi:hypothetical protein
MLSTLFSILLLAQSDATGVENTSIGTRTGGVAGGRSSLGSWMRPQPYSLGIDGVLHCSMLPFGPHDDHVALVEAFAAAHAICDDGGECDEKNHMLMKMLSIGRANDPAFIKRLRNPRDDAQGCALPDGTALPPGLTHGAGWERTMVRGDLAGVAQLWRTLDAIMLHHDPDAPFAGHIRPVQAVAILDAIDRVEATTYCEIGMNGGHSASVVLAGRPGVYVVSFDLGMFAYSQPVADLLGVVFGERFRFVQGNSLETVPRFVRELGGQISCDVLFIDGGHDLEIVASDIRNLRPLVNTRRAEGHAIFLDDTESCLDLPCRFNAMLDCVPPHGICSNCQDCSIVFPGTGAREAVLRAKEEGVLRDYAFHDYRCGK